MADALIPRPSPFPSKRPRPLFLRLVAALLGMVIGAALAADRGAYVSTREGRRACIEGALFLRVPVPRKGGVSAVARRFTGSADNAAEILKASNLPRKKRPSEVRVPLDLLMPAYRDELLAALFPDDSREREGWLHAWGSSPFGPRETWKDLGRWFCGSPKRGEDLRRANPKAGAHPKAGTEVLIPEGLLVDALAEVPPPLPEPQAPATVKPVPPEPQAGTSRSENPPPEGGIGPPLPQLPAPKPAASEPPAALAGSSSAATTGPVPAPLTYGTDAQGEYAVYRLQAGEALYSAVVVRFTGTVGAEDVNALAMEVARRSGIADVTSIPVGYAVKIPLEDLLPQFLPPDSARYQAWARNRTELGQVTNTYKSAALDGVVVVLDPGHGGLDRGAMAHGVWEDSYVYDIACRMREAVEKRTKARVLMTLLVPGLGYRPLDRPRLEPNKTAVILTHPWFRLTSSAETKVEVNLRWHLANQYFERLQKEGVDPQRVVFTSIHADSLHPSLRGTMFYIAGTDYRAQRWCSSGESYGRFKEVQAKGCYELTEKQMKRAEGLSWQFARALEKAFDAGNLALHPYDATRDHVVRGRRSWVPAVLRNAIVPCSVLIEVCNLNNAKDAALLADPGFRQAVADAYVDALIRYYS